MFSIDLLVLRTPNPLFNANTGLVPRISVVYLGHFENSVLEGGLSKALPGPAPITLILNILKVLNNNTRLVIQLGSL